MRQNKRFSSIKSSLIIYSTSLLIIAAALPMYTLNMTNRYKEQIDNMFETQIYLSDIEETLNSVDDNLLGFLSSKNSSKLNQYMIDSETLRTTIVESSVITNNVEDLMIKDIGNMIGNYLEVADNSISLKRQRNVKEYVEVYTEASKIKGYVLDYIDQVNIIQLDENSINYLYMVEQIETMQRVTTILIVDLILVSIVVVYLITSRMITPITNLSHSAEEISKGRFNTKDIIVESDDEIRIMADAFNKMKNSIGTYIDEMKTKAETEAKLKDQQVENLKMQNLLDNAKLYALQSQINPHFLFNTINAGVQMSMLEGADRTSEFLESMSSLFRYNIKKMDSEVTLEDELSNVENYYELLKVRFGDLIQFKFMIDPETLTTKMPPLILQPLVENAYVHGLSSREGGGAITISAVKSNDYTTIAVKDDGTGMNPERIVEILKIHDDTISSKGAGIGVRNVRDRLKIFYHEDDIFSIESKEDEGTKIMIRIPNKVLAYFM